MNSRSGLMNREVFSADPVEEENKKIKVAQTRKGA